MPHQILMWAIFGVLVLVLLALDLGVFHKKEHTIRIREALIWSAVWVGISLLFNLAIYFWQGSIPAMEFFTGYLLEKSLSVDNLFVFLLIFSYFKVDSIHQHKILFWGIIGALIMRAIFIAAGITLITKFHWVIYIFGALLVVTGIKMALEKDKEIHPEKNPILKIFRKFFPVTHELHGGKFFVKIEGKRFFTPLFVVLLVVETTDVVFAVDSVPAVLAITLDPFIVYTSNVFAILGLRALYFALAGIMEIFHHLHYGLSAILVFVGAKMLLANHYKIPLWIALGTIAAILVVSIVASVIWPEKKKIPQ